MNNKIILAKAGIDALSATDPNDFIFHSDYNTFQITATGTDTFTVTAASTETKTIAHGLSYTPAVNGFMRRTNSNDTRIIGVGSFRVETSALNTYKLFSVFADTANVSFEIRNDSSSDQDFIVRYYAFEPPL